MSGSILQSVIILSSLILIAILLYIPTNRKRRTNLTYKDKLTGLGNSTFFHNEYFKKICEKEGGRFAFVILDIDDFNLVNKVYGMNIGNIVLEHIGEVLKNNVTETELAARIDGDEFALLLNIEKNPEDLHSRLENISNSIKGFLYEDIQLKPSLGIYIVEQEYSDIKELSTNAYIAKKMIKNTSETISYYEFESVESLLANKKLLIDFKQAIEEKEFKVQYQLKYDLKEQRPIGAEALARWSHKEKGFILPNSFIPLLELHGGIEILDMYVLDRVSKDIKKWITLYGEEMKDFRVAVNLSKNTILSEAIVEQMVEIVECNGISPSNIEIEITETSFYEKPKRVIETIEEMKEQGFIVAMDDFGSGYSSLNTLRDIDIDVLKIDKEFLNGNLKQNKANKIIENIVKLAKDIGVKIVVEGVETLEQEKLIKLLGCDIGQGYLYSKPIYIEEFEEKVIKPFILSSNKSK